MGPSQIWVCSIDVPILMVKARRGYFFLFFCKKEKEKKKKKRLIATINTLAQILGVGYMDPFSALLRAIVSIKLTTLSYSF